jgi:hypothetical protein
MSYLFISYSRENRELVERLRQELEQAGLSIWIDKEDLKVGSVNWEQVLRDAIEGASSVLVMVSPSSRRSPYVNAEIAVAKSAKKTIYPCFIEGESWVDSAPFELIMTQGLDLRGAAYQENLPQLILALQAHSPKQSIPEVSSPTVQPLLKEPRNPYKGLRAFRAEDKGDFFGRGDLVNDLVKWIGDGRASPRLRALLGASGSGKSSVMLAGVLPKLQAEAPDWLFLDSIVPSSQPIEKLSVALARKLPNKSHAVIHQDLYDTSSRGLHRLAGEISEKPVVLYIDQFEEVFTLVDKEAERRQFIDLLTTALSEKGGTFYLLLSMRADFYDRPVQYGDFGQLIESHHRLIAPMSLAELFNVVNLPAQLPDVQLQFEQGLVTEMVYEVRQEAAALPLLQFTLDQLFQQREGQKLSLQSYHALGGVKGALAKHADATFDNLPSEQHKRLARSLFLRLIEAGATEQDTTRRRAKYSELSLVSVEDTRILQDVADAFIEARLLTSDQTDNERSLEVSHEALIREWQRLGDWLHEAREDLRIQKALQNDVAEWLRRGKPDDFLPYGSSLAEQLAWAERNNPSRDEAMFLDAASSAEAAQKAEDARIARRVQNFQRASLVLGIMVFLALIAVGSAIAAFLTANSQANEAQTQVAGADTQILAAGLVLTAVDEEQATAVAQQATSDALLNAVPPTLTAVALTIADANEQLTLIESQRLAALSEGVLLQANGNDEIGDLLAIQAFQTANTSEALSLVYRRVGSPNYRFASLEGHRGIVRGALELSDGRLLSWANDSRLRLWGEEGTFIASLEGHSSVVYGALELSDGRLLSWSGDGSLRFWDSEGTFIASLEGHTERVIGALELSDGRLLSWSDDNTLRLWDREGSFISSLEGHRNSVYGAIELGDGRLLSWGYDSSLRLWDREGSFISSLEGHSGWVTGVLELKDGRLLSWSSDNTLRLWDREGSFISSLEGHTDLVRGAMELSDGGLLSWSEGGSLRLWDREGTFLASLEGHLNDINGVLELSDGHLLSWSDDSTLRLWDREGTFLASLEGHSSVVNGALELSDGLLLSWSGDVLNSLSGDNSLRLWDREGRIIATLEGHGDAVVGVLELSDGRLLSWSWDGSLRLWDREGSFPASLEGHIGWVYGALELSDGRLLSWSRDGGLRLWNGKGSFISSLEGHTSTVYGALELSDGRLLSWSADGSLRLWDREGTFISSLEGHTNSVNGALELSDGRLLSWSNDSSLRLWDREGNFLTSLEGHEDVVWGALELSDGRLFSWSWDGSLRLWDREGTFIANLEGHTDRVTGALELSDGRLLSWSNDSSLRLWDREGVFIANLEGHTDYVEDAVELSDGRLLSSSADGSLRLWDREGIFLASLEGHRSIVFGALELSDGRLLSWSGDMSLRLWDREGIFLASLEGHTERVYGAIELGDGRLLSWSFDSSLRLWSREGTFLASLEGHTDRVTGVLELSDGRLLSWSNDQTLRFWEINLDALLDLACRRVLRDFTPEERTLYDIPDGPTCPKFANQ